MNNNFSKSFIRNIIFPKRLDCPFCGGEISTEIICKECKERLVFTRGERKVQGMRVNFPLVYNVFFRELLHRYKFRGETYLGEVFAKILADSIQDFCLSADLIISIPEDNFTEALRGFYPVGIIAERLSILTGIPNKNIIKKNYRTKKQSLSDYGERHSNLRGVFSLKKGDVSGRKLLLIDDIITTGSTLKEALRVLNEGGFENVSALTLASA